MIFLILPARPPNPLEKSFDVPRGSVATPQLGWILKGTWRTTELALCHQSCHETFRLQTPKAEDFWIDTKKTHQEKYDQTNKSVDSQVPVFKLDFFGAPLPWEWQVLRDGSHYTTILERDE